MCAHLISFLFKKMVPTLTQHCDSIPKPTPLTLCSEMTVRHAANHATYTQNVWAKCTAIKRYTGERPINS